MDTFEIAIREGGLVQNDGNLNCLVMGGFEVWSNLFSHVFGWQFSSPNAGKLQLAQVVMLNHPTL